MAFEQMPPAKRQAVAETIRKHPHYKQHFADRMPDAIRKGTREEQDRWLFAAAGSWADYVRSHEQALYNRPTWHYVNYHVFLTDRDEAELNPPDPPTEPGVAFDTQKWNVIQATKAALRVVGDPKSSDADKAIRTCWLFHCVQDAHQPCHSSSLYTLGRFRNGDRGANSIKTKPGRNLHAVWDNAILGSGRIDKIGDYNKMRKKAKEFLAVKLSTEERFDAGDAPWADSVDGWITTSHVAAEKHVYTPLIRDYVRQREGASDFGKVELPTGYFRHAADVCRIRAILAARRLAGLLGGVE